MHTDFQYYRAHVSIVQVAESLGYVHNPKAGRNPVEYTHPTYENILISNPWDSTRQVYFTRNQDDNRGDVVEFVRQRLSLFHITYNNPIHGIKKVLDGFAKIPYDLDQKFGLQASSHAKPTSFVADHYQITAPTLDDLGYLSRERKLDDKTLKTFLPYIAIVQSKLYQYNFRNIGFAYQVPGEAGFGRKPLSGISTRGTSVRGYELVNYNYKRFAPGTDKSHAVWLASLSPVGTPVQHIVLAESAIDAMSFYQLHRHRPNFAGALYVSVGGTLSSGQAEKVVDCFPDAKLHAAFDNDLNGQLYTIRLSAIKAQKPLMVSRQLAQNNILFELSHKQFTLPLDNLSLEAFKKESGLRPLVRQHKSQGKDFNEMLQQRFYARQQGLVSDAPVAKARSLWK